MKQSPYKIGDKIRVINIHFDNGEDKDITDGPKYRYLVGKTGEIIGDVDGTHPKKYHTVKIDGYDYLSERKKGLTEVHLLYLNEMKKCAIKIDGDGNLQ